MLERTESEWGPWTIVEATDRYWRSEEHTSELQSLRHLVCRLLLEKKRGAHLHSALGIVSQGPRTCVVRRSRRCADLKPFAAGESPYARLGTHYKRCSFFFNDTATTEIYTLSLHDALPISLLPTEFNHYEGALARTLGLPT